MQKYILFFISGSPDFLVKEMAEKYAREHIEDFVEKIKSALL